MKSIEDKLSDMGLKLPPAPSAQGVYHPVLIQDKLLYVSGQGPMQDDGTLITGKVGSELSLEEGQLAARQVGLTMLATIKSQIGDLGRIKRLIKTLGMVNCFPEFEKHPQTINGFSQLMVDLWGETNGKGARSAVGMSLPMNIAVEVECIFELHPAP
jgi:enamine deaminase RidA (YjgF/YER057c/UK114 family)